MKQIVVFFVVFLLCYTSVAGTKETLISSGHGGYPPFSWKQGDKIVGLGPDLAALIFKELDITVESRYLGPWKR
ncbi:MAG: hypothetical protein KUG78_20095, partial [Kangiellaceae bacterium]|nr:hypothetical protein [Kangiellaceae bacterium]